MSITMVHRMDCAFGWCKWIFGCDKRKDGFNADLRDRAHTLSNWLYMLIGPNWCPRGFPWHDVAAFFPLLSLPQAAKCTLNIVGRLRSFCLANHFCLQKYGGISGSRSPSPSLPLVPSLRRSSHPLRGRERKISFFFLVGVKFLFLWLNKQS